MEVTVTDWEEDELSKMQWKMQWALVSRRDENDRLYSLWGQIPVEDRPYADDPFGRKFRIERCARRISLMTVADAMGTTPAYVSGVERGVYGLTDEEKQEWWLALDDLR